MCTAVHGNGKQTTATILVEQVPTTDHTFEDCRLMEYAKKANLKIGTGLVEFKKMQKKLGLVDFAYIAAQSLEYLPLLFSRMFVILLVL